MYNHTEYMRMWRARLYKLHPELRLAYNKQCLEYKKEYMKKHSDLVLEQKRKSCVKYRKDFPEAVKAQSFIGCHKDEYPLDSECEFCNSTEHLEHGHIDYAYPDLYLTVCHVCNCYMEVSENVVREKP